MTFSRRHSGFVSLPVAAGLVALAVILGLSLALKVQGARLDAKAAELEACQSRYAEALQSIAKQNEAVKQLQDDAQKRTRIAAAALAKAREGQGSLKAEIERLRGAIGSGKTCSEAVEAVRKGLIVVDGKKP